MDKHIVVYDFSKKPSATFYRILDEEFGISATSPEHVQRSVLIVEDKYRAYGVAALIEAFGGEALLYQITEHPDRVQLIAEARLRIARIRRRRRSRKEKPE